MYRSPLSYLLIKALIMIATPKKITRRGHGLSHVSQGKTSLRSQMTP